MTGEEMWRDKSEKKKNEDESNDRSTNCYKRKLFYFPSILSSHSARRTQYVELSTSHCMDVRQDANASNQLWSHKFGSGGSSAALRVSTCQSPCQYDNVWPFSGFFWLPFRFGWQREAAPVSYSCGMLRDQIGSNRIRFVLDLKTCLILFDHLGWYRNGYSNPARRVWGLFPLKLTFRGDFS